MVWRDRFWVQQGEERKKIDTLLHRPRGKETQPWLVIVFLLYFDGRTVNGLIRRLLSKKRNLSREKREQKVFFGVFLLHQKNRKKKLAFPSGLHYSLGPPFFAFLSAFFVFSLLFLYSFFPCSYVGKAGCNVGQRGTWKASTFGLCQVGYLNGKEKLPSFQGLKRNN